MKHKLSRKWWKNTLTGYAFIGLFCVGFICFTIIPILSSLYYSFCDYDVLSPAKFKGLKNYIALFGDEQFWVSLKATMMYVVFSVPLKLIFSLMIAMLLYQTNRMTSFYRAAYYLPSIVGGSVAIAIVWRQMFSGDGLLNSIINAVFGTHLDKSWIGSTDTAIWTLIILSVWQFGSSMLNFPVRPQADSRIAVRIGQHRRRHGGPPLFPHHAADADADDLLQSDYADDPGPDLLYAEPADHARRADEHDAFLRRVYLPHLLQVLQNGLRLRAGVGAAADHCGVHRAAVQITGQMGVL